MNNFCRFVSHLFVFFFLHPIYPIGKSLIRHLSLTIVWIREQSHRLSLCEWIVSISFILLIFLHLYFQKLSLFPFNSIFFFEEIRKYKIYLYSSCHTNYLIRFLIRKVVYNEILFKVYVPSDAVTTRSNWWSQIK